MSKNKNLKVKINGIIRWTHEAEYLHINSLIISTFAIGRNINTTTVKIIISLQADIKLIIYKKCDTALSLKVSVSSFGVFKALYCLIQMT